MFKIAPSHIFTTHTSLWDIAQGHRYFCILFEIRPGMCGLLPGDSGVVMLLLAS
jgi:hypothetical protein